MTTPYARVERAFVQLRTYRLRPGRAAAIDLRNTAPDRVRLSKDTNQHLHLDIEFPSGREKPALPTSSVVPHAWVDSENSRWLRIACPQERFETTFLALTAQTLAETDAGDRHPVDAFSNALAHWRELLSSLQGVLSDTEAVGLFGELLLLESFAYRDPAVALALWRGPTGNRHDFVGTNSLEVKSYTGTNDPRVTIHGSEQLSAPASGKLFLVAIGVEEHPDGRSLEDLYRTLDTAGVPIASIVETTGVSLDTVKSNSQRYLLRALSVYSVDHDFPSLTPNNLMLPRALQGVSDLRYALSLSAIESFRVDIEMSEIFDLLGGAGND